MLLNTDDKYEAFTSQFLCIQLQAIFFLYSCLKLYLIYNMGILVRVAKPMFNIDEVIREASTSEKVSLLSGMAPDYSRDGWIDKL